MKRRCISRTIQVSRETLRYSLYKTYSSLTSCSSSVCDAKGSAFIHCMCSGWTHAVSAFKKSLCYVFEIPSVQQILNLHHIFVCRALAKNIPGLPCSYFFNILFRCCLFLFSGTVCCICCCAVLSLCPLPSMQPLCKSTVSL